MSHPELSWPALAGAVSKLPLELDFELGIWGKAEGAASDFRWIAASRGLLSAHPHLARELYLGTEDQGRPAWLWRTLDGGRLHAAAACTPSKAVDAAGRSTSLEKQVLLWERPPVVPGALGALLLLPRAAERSSGAWWADRPDPRWQDDAFLLPVEDRQLQPVQATAEVLSRALEAGLAGLAAALSEDELAELYAALLAGRRPAVARDLGPDLPPEALGALLLPLPRSLADGLSLAGAVPSARFHSKKLARLWDIVATEAPSSSWTAGVPSATEAQRQQARRMASAVFHRDPGQLAPRSSSTGSPATARDDTVQLALWGPSAAGKTALLAQLHLEAGAEASDWEIFPTAESLSFIDQMRQKSRRENRFPPATVVNHVERIAYRFRHRRTGCAALLAVEDRAGKESEALYEFEGLRGRLQSADGLVLLFDPDRDGALLETEVHRALDWVHVASGREGGRDERPVAVCLSKSDRRIHSAEDLSRAAADPDSFVRERLSPPLLRAFDRFLARYRLFPVSAVGLRLVWGSVEPVVFYDEALTPRFCPRGHPLNLMAPFAWLLDEIGKA